MNANDVIITGLKRNLAPSVAASCSGTPCSRRSLANSTPVACGLNRRILGCFQHRVLSGRAHHTAAYSEPNLGGLRAVDLNQCDFSLSRIAWNITYSGGITKIPSSDAASIPPNTGVLT
jgi:hypothetical protein